MNWKYLSLSVVVAIAAFTVYIGYHPYQCELIEVNNNSITHFSKVFRCKFIRADELLTKDNFAHREIIALSSKPVTSSGLSMLHKRREYYSEPVYVDTTQNSTCYTSDNTTYSCQINVTVIDRYERKYRMINSWEPLETDNQGNISFNPTANVWYYFRHDVRKKAELGNVSINVQTFLFGYELPWTWWNTTVTYKQPIQINQTGSEKLEGYPALANGSYGIDTAALVTASKLDANGYCLFLVNANEDGELYWHFVNETSTNYGINADHTLIRVNVTIPTTNTTIFIYYDSNCGAGSHASYMDSDNVYDANFKGVWYWHEEQGSILNDYSGSSNDMTASGNAAYSTHGEEGYGGYLDGTDDHWTRGGDDDDFDSLDYTVEMWVDPRATMQLDTGMPMSKGTANQYHWMVAVDDDVDIRATIWTCAGQGYLDTLGDAGWTPDNSHHYVASTVDNSNTNLTIRADDRLIDYTTSTYGTRCTTSTAKFRIGERADGARDFKGYLDTMWYSNSVRSDSWLVRGHYINESYMSSEWEMTEAPTDTCTSPATDNDWVVDCDDNCTLTSDTDLGTGYLNLTGTEGNLTIAANLTYYGLNWSSTGTCKIYLQTGYKIVRSD